MSIAQTTPYAPLSQYLTGMTLFTRISNTFTDWERVIVALHENNIAGYCTVAKSDCTPNVSYTPYIGYMFVDEKYRGHHLSQKLISYAISYLQTQGFHHVYLVSDHENFYELCLQMNGKRIFCLWMRRREGRFPGKWELPL